jgi:hypothetical protein
LVVVNMSLTDTTATLRVMDSKTAAAALSRGPESARGFLGLDPVTQNEPLLAASLTRMAAEVYAADDALVGFAPVPGQPRQMLVATTSAHPGPLAALLAFLRTYCRASSYLARVPAGHPSATALADCGLIPTGVLHEHWYQSGEYRDVTVYYARAADACRS